MLGYVCGREERGGEGAGSARKKRIKRGKKEKKRGGLGKTTFNPNPRHLGFEYTPFETYLLELVIEA